jgi:hypothetical protein
LINSQKVNNAIQPGQHYRYESSMDEKEPEQPIIYKSGKEKYYSSIDAKEK